MKEKNKESYFPVFESEKGPYLYNLLDDGEIPDTMIGTHKRIKIEDLLDYKRKRDGDRREALSELITLSQELGFYNLRK